MSIRAKPRRQTWRAPGFRRSCVSEIVSGRPRTVGEELMALHKADRPAEEQLADIFTSRLSEAPLPKYRMPETQSVPRVAYALVRDELSLDGDASQNLATFCTTWADDETYRLMAGSLGKNVIDKDEYPQTAEIESRCVHILADLWNSPEPRHTIGCSTTGSSEAAMLGGLALKWSWRKRRRAEGADASRPNIVAGRCRSAGRNSRATSTWSCARSRWRKAPPVCARTSCATTSTRTPSASSRSSV